MALVLNEEQSMLRDSARAFLAAEAPLSHLRALRDRADSIGYSPDLWRRCAQMGYASVLIAEAHGGSGLGLTEAMVIAEEFGRTLAPTPYLSTAVLGARLLGTSTNASVRAHWLPRMAAGSAVTALAVDEHARHRPTAITLLARASDDGFRLHGNKLFVIDGHVADLILVAASLSLPGTKEDRKSVV